MERFFKQKKGITLIALVVTIIVLLILAGISISMLTGNNGIIQRAGDAKEKTEKVQIIESAQTDIIGQQTENKGTNITKEQLSEILNKYFTPTDPTEIPDEVSTEHDHELTTLDEKYNINLSEIFKGKFSTQNNVVTLGEKYDEYENNNNSLIGKTINYTSANHDSDIQTSGGWIILGKQVNVQGKSDVIITTKNPVSTLQINGTLAEWIGYETKINNACSNYVGITGTLGTKAATIKEVRSITMEDINNAVGFSETISSVTLGGTSNDLAYPKDNGSGWVVKGTDENYDSWTFPIKAYNYYKNGETYSYLSGTSYATITLGKPNNMAYILANNTDYFIASRSVGVTPSSTSFNVALLESGDVNNTYHSRLCWSNVNGGNDYAHSDSRALRPCVVLSSEIPWDDVKDLIGDYAEYN